ncbi:hypothetical protein Y032_0043g803 [Ancylostoma ceylanicum]|uniref:Uncharacterized protein n=1 Tax=Ancylostoma ceylanicum TaxID=53326 RepID=A0A016UEM8_9BILA|nr:hypothetical protein Y032_0043g803 [Ancylostoma ceylanicum]
MCASNWYKLALSEPGPSTGLPGGKLSFLKRPKSKGGLVPGSRAEPRKKYRRIEKWTATRLLALRAAQ